MTQVHNRFVPFGCLIALVFAVSSRAVEVVEVVDVRGLEEHDGDLVRRAMGLSVGDTLELESLRDAVRRLHGLSLFDELEVHADREGSGLRLEVRVKESPRLDDVDVRGVDKLSDTEVEESVRAVAGQVLDRREIEEAAIELRGLLRERGYLNATADVRIEPGDDGKVRVIIDVRAGEEVRIGSVYISGNRFFSDDELKGLLENKEDRWFRGGEFKKDELELDLEKIELHYRKAGFRDIDAYEHRIEYKADGSEMVLDILVDEGARYYMGELTWDGNEVLDDVDLQRLFKLRRGAAFDGEKFAAANQEIGTFYADRGYIYVSVQPEEVAREDTIDVHVGIVEDEPAHIRRVEIAGTSRTQEHVIRRELHVYPGDLYSASRITRSLQAVFNLGYFENVEPAFEQLPDKGELDLVWNVEEKFTGQFNVAVGYSALDQVTGVIGLGHPNLFGRGWAGNFNWEFGRYKRQFVVSFTEPWLFDTPTSVGGDLFSIDRYRYDYYEERRGASVRFARPVPDVAFTRLYTTWKVEDVDVDVDDDQYYALSRFETDGPQRTISTLWNVVRDSRDNFQFPTSGSRTSFSAEFAGALLGGDIGYQKYTARSTWSVPVIGKSAIHLSAEGGLVDGYSSPNEVPIYERFEMGGTFANPLRGYPDRSIGPIENGVVIGGRVMLKSSVELTVPITENQVYALAFFDAGNTWESLAKTHPSDLNRGAGVGARLAVPGIGLIGFDFGYGFDRPDGAQWEPHFQFGNQSMF